MPNLFQETKLTYGKNIHSMTFNFLFDIAATSK